MCWSRTSLRDPSMHSCQTGLFKTFVSQFRTFLFVFGVWIWTACPFSDRLILDKKPEQQTYEKRAGLYRKLLFLWNNSFGLEHNRVFLTVLANDWTASVRLCSKFSFKQRTYLRDWSEVTADSHCEQQDNLTRSSFKCAWLGFFGLN